MELGICTLTNPSVGDVILPMTDTGSHFTLCIHLMLQYAYVQYSLLYHILLIAYSA